MNLRPLHHRKVVHAVHPAPVSRPRLRTGKLECDHVFIDEGVLGKKLLVKCHRCAGEPTPKEIVELWSALNDVVSRSPERLPEEEKTPTIRTRVVEEYTPDPPPPPPEELPNEVVSCSLCGGLPTIKTCPTCKGTKRKWRYGPRVYPKQRLVLFLRPTLEDLTSMGFSTTGKAVESVDERHLGLLARARMRARSPTERWYWDGRLAHHGWFYRPLTTEEVLRKYPPKVSEKPEKVEQNKVPHWSTPGGKVTRLRPKAEE